MTTPKRGAKKSAKRSPKKAATKAATKAAKPSAGTKAQTAGKVSSPRKSATQSAASKPPRAAKPSTAPTYEKAAGEGASRLIDQRIRELGDWRGETLARMRTLILEADPNMLEEWKWMGTPVWSDQGMVCTGETYKQVVKLTFAYGAVLPDPARLFNASLEGATRRAIDIRQGETIDANAFKALVRAAVARNVATKKR